MRRLLALVLLAGCSAAPARIEGDRAVLENATLRIDFLPDGAGVSLRSARGWYPAAVLRGVRFSGGEVVPGPFPSLRLAGGGLFTLRGHQVWFESPRGLEVEVAGERSMALFPGLEFLEGQEFSSSDRDAHGVLADRRRPEPWKITVPLMAYEVDRSLVALLWKEPRPAFFEAREKNRMSIAGAGVLHVEDRATIYDAVPRWIDTFGFPAPEPWPRTMAEELTLCRAGFESVSAPGGKHRHCIGWDAAPTPGFGVLLHHLGEKVDWSAYPDLLSTANCHILQWEAAFLAGRPELVRNLPGPLMALARTRDDGEWVFAPADAKQATLGKRGDKVLGTSARNVLTIAKAARMTGDEHLEFVAFETLRRLRKYKVPRGAQSWECPLYEPDLLAAAFAVGAYIEAFKLSGDRKQLEEAARWAKAGLPFLYLWSLPDRPGMLYASIPVFGTTHFTHSWFGVPVQWNGLVYAYYLRKLAPLDAGFDWKRVADGITASGVHQQYTAGPSKGCYPDGFYDQCTRRAPPDLNPEDLLVNILAMIGKDPDPDLTLRK